MSRLDLTVRVERAPQTLLALISEAVGDRDRAMALITRGAAFVGGRRAKQPQQSLAAGTRVVLHVEDRGPELAEAALEPRVIFEDEAVIVLDKRPGEHLNETETSVVLSLVERLRARIPEVRVVHRLDRETSGVVILAKTLGEAERLSAAFREREVEKRYVALVEGAIADQLIEAKIAPDRRRPRARRVLDSGQAAATRVTTLAVAHGLSAVSAVPITGRTHQIRVHLAHAGAPILGDRLYGGPLAVRVEGELMKLGRTLLHARELIVPLAGGTRRFEAPVPEDLARFATLGLPVE
ncbi:MAG: RluA family pseudouridine synthase [Deltaproteobacteria bacterium]|nr:RluA family pseudouridine synthase [Deltaproteobacteria bacterium]